MLGLGISPFCCAHTATPTRTQDRQIQIESNTREDSPFLLRASGASRFSRLNPHATEPTVHRCVWSARARTVLPATVPRLPLRDIARTHSNAVAGASQCARCARDLSQVVRGALGVIACGGTAVQCSHTRTRHVYATTSSLALYGIRLIMHVPIHHVLICALISGASHQHIISY